MLKYLRLNSKLTPYSKLFIYGVIFETMLFFILFPGGQLSRILQFSFLLISFFIFSIAAIKKINIEIDIKFIENNLFLNLFILLIPISFLIGFFSDNLGIALNSYQLNDFTRSTFESIVISRSITETFILLYYFFFFYFLTYLLVNNKESIDFFFRIFKILFLLHLVLGYADYFFVSVSGYDLIPRHFYDGINVGARFHGIAGEPRQAGVYMALGLSITYLESYYKQSKFNYWWLAVTVPAIFLTLSFTAIISIVIFLLLLTPIFLFIFYKKPFISFITFFLFLFFLYLASEVPRIADYIEVFSRGLEVLESNKKLPYLIRVQLGEVYPLYDQYKALLSSNYLQFFFGSGIGTSAINNYSYVDLPDAFGNPNSQLIRSIYESGFLGTAFFTLIFYWPIINNNRINFNTKLSLYILTSLVLAFSYGVRSPAIFIFFGLMSSLLSNNLIKDYDKK